MELKNKNMCFACGENNPIGLHLDFAIDNKKQESSATFVPKAEHQGYSDIIHGGILALVMDEAMVKLAFQLGLNAVSVNFNVNLRKPAKVGDKLKVQGKILSHEGRKIKAEAKLTDARGEIVADATGLLIKLEK